MLCDHEVRRCEHLCELTLPAGRPTQALQRCDEVARQSRILPQRLLQRAADSERLELQARHRNLVDRIGDQLLLFTEIDLRRTNRRPERRDRAECCSGARQSVLAAAQQLHGSNKVTASHDRIFDGNVRLEELGRPIEQRLTVACQLLNVLSGELEADVAAATSSAVDSSLVITSLGGIAGTIRESLPNLVVL